MTTATTCSSRVATLLLLSLASTTAAAQSILTQHGQIVQAVGDPVAAIPGATIFATSNFDSPVMDQNGTIVYRARMAGAVTALDDRAYFMGRANGDLTMVLRAGDQAPGLPAGIFLRSDTTSAQGPSSVVRISPFGDILFFLSTLSDDANPAVTTANDTALFWGPVGNFAPLAREGDQVPFLGAGITYGPLSISLQNNAINASGQVLFPATLLGAVTTANDALLVTGGPGTLVAVSREGDVLPGGEVVIPVSGTTTMSFVNQINELGQVLHELRFDVNPPSTANASNDRALAIWSAGTDTIIAREGQQAPGLPAGVLFATPTSGWTVDMGGAAFTKSGKTAINAALDGGGTLVGVDDRAVYFGGIGGLNLVMRRGDACPGLPGITFGVIGTSGLTCNETEVAFVGFLTGGTAADDSSLWRGSNLGNLTLIAREGDNVPATVLAPSVNGPWKYNQLNNGTNNVLLNGRGDLIFQASVTDTVVTKNVLLCSSAGPGLQLLLDYTESFTTGQGSGAVQSVSSNAGFNSGDGGQPHFNNQGDFVVKPGFLAPVTSAIVRGHVGSLQAKPASISSVAGGTQNWAIDCGAAQAFNIYAVISSASGTRPGVPSPLGPQTIPLNFDAWTQLSLDLANSAVYTNSLWFLDAQGRSTASFNLPAGLPGAQGLELHHAVVVLNGSLASTFVSEPASMRVY